MRSIFVFIFILTSPAAFSQRDLPAAPAAIGNYSTFKKVGNLVYINQIALSNGAVKHPGTVGKDVSLRDAQEATRVTILNVLATLKIAAGGDLSRVRQAVQLTGLFKTAPEFTEHAQVLNAASDVLVEFLGDRGKHARASLGVSSLPLNSPVELQAIFELE